jgi:hypothetical protein
MEDCLKCALKFEDIEPRTLLVAPNITAQEFLDSMPRDRFDKLIAIISATVNWTNAFGIGGV